MHQLHMFYTILQCFILVDKRYIYMITVGVFVLRCVLYYCVHVSLNDNDDDILYSVFVVVHLFIQTTFVLFVSRH